MRRIVPLAIVSAVALAAGSFQAQANFTLTTTLVSINSTLQAQGWEGLVITLTADATSQTVAGVNLSTDELSAGGTIGIFGAIHQMWAVTKTNSTNRTATPFDIAGGLNAVFAFRNDGTDTDSKFLNNTYYTFAVPNAFTEDNNRTNIASNPPYTGSPLTDVAVTSKTIGLDFGVGSLMTFAGFPIGTDATQTLDVAFVIVPTNGLLAPVRFRGTVTGSDFQTHLVDVQLNAAVPEPASLGVLALGGLALLSKRRRKA